MADVQLDDRGRPEPPLTGSEVETLLGFLDFQRATLAWRCRGLDDAQLRTTRPPSALSLGGLLMHLARVEDVWFSEVVAEQPLPEPWASTPWAAEWQDAAEQTGDELRSPWQQRVEASRTVVAARLAQDGPAALDATHPAWGGQGRPSLRWVLVHDDGDARYDGHADLLREAIDGVTGE